MNQDTGLGALDVLWLLSELCYEFKKNSEGGIRHNLLFVLRFSVQLSENIVLSGR